MKPPTSILLILLSLLTTTHALPTKRTILAGQYGRLIVFGDSYSDNGTGAWTISNHTWPSDPAYYLHSFSNGPVWPILLSHTLSAPLLDYAVGGATADNAIVAGYTGLNSTILVPSAREQVDRFLAEEKVGKDDLFVHYIGANDPLFDVNVTGATVAALVGADIQRLWAAGAKHVLLANYPFVSTFPATYNESTYQKIGPAYAASLDQGLANVRAAWSAYMAIGVVDVQALFVDILKSPAKYGVREENVDPPTPCLKGTYGSGERSVCEDPDAHLYWDGYHPVGRVHERIEELFVKALGG